MRLFLSVAVAVALIIAPLQAYAVQAERTVQYRTTYYLVYPLESPGDYPGRMTLHFTPKGEVSGTYRDEYAGGYIHVAGGLTGTKLWLTFGGARGTRQLRGTLHADGTITGSLTHWQGMHTYKFSAVPVTS